MKHLMKFSALLALLLAFTSTGFAQAALTQTTLSAAVNAPAGASGLNNSYDTSVILGSATGIKTAQNGSPVTVLYIDQEAMAVLDNPTSTIFNVLRGQFGTKASAHASGTMVLAQIVSPQFAGYSGSGGMQVNDPPLNGACTAANTLVTPWVNMLTGEQWLCSTITKTWIPGFKNRFTGSFESVSTLVASAAGQVTPSGPLFHINGTQAITGFLIPIGFNATAVGGGQFCVIPDGTFTTTTANNIALASTAVVNKLLCWEWDATNQKFVPSY